MITRPEQFMIDAALRAAANSPCRSQRGVALFDMANGAFRGSGFNSPPTGCPGRAVCTGTCGKRAVHAEMRALREAEAYRRNGHPPGPYDLIHVELAADGGVVACSGPSCPSCAAQILDVGFVGGVWLYEGAQPPLCGAYLGDNDATCPQLTCVRWLHHDGDCDNVTGAPPPVTAWRRYTAEEFYEVTMRTVLP